MPGSFDLRSAPHEGRIVREAPQITELKLKVDALRNRARAAEHEVDRLRREHAPAAPSVATRMLTPLRRMWNGTRRSSRDI